MKLKNNPIAEFLTKCSACGVLTYGKNSRKKYCSKKCQKIKYKKL